MSKIISAFDRIVDLIFYISCFSMIFAWLMTSADVIMRYFFNSPILWSVEINEYILAGTTFLSASYVLKKDGHVAIDSALHLFKPKQKVFINFLMSILGAIVCLIIFWFGLLKTFDQFQLGTITSDKTIVIPFFILLLIMPISFFFFTYQFLRRAGSEFSILKKLKN